MAFDKLTIKQLYDRIISDMESRLTSGVKIPTTSMLSVLAFGMAGGSYMVQGFLDWIYNQILPDLADETGVNRWATILNIPQKSAEFTTGEAAFTGTTGETIASGTQLQNEDGLAYETQASFTIGTDTSVSVEAIEAGADWNITSGLSMVSPQSGVDDDVTIISGFDDGVDEETFDNWVVRILQRLQNPPSSGTVADYERWALEVEGVYYAWCFGAEEWMGAGTVGVAVSGENHAAVSAGILSDVTDYLDSVAPIPANRTDYSPTPKAVDYAISITPNTSEIQTAITTNIQEMYDADAAPAGTIYLSRTGSAISSGGVSDYEITGIDVDGSPVTVGNITTTLNYVHQLGTITFSAL